MSKSNPTDQERLASIEAQAEKAHALRAHADQAEDELQVLTAEARRDGLLSKDLMDATGWSHQKMARVLRKAGLSDGRSAPRKRPSQP